MIFTDHLGNVRLVFSDLKKVDAIAPNRKPYALDLTAVNNYYPFGMLMPENNWQSGLSRYGFNGHENDNEVKGTGNHIAFGDYGYDTRLGRRWQIEPKIKDMPFNSSYSTYSNNPIWLNDISGENPTWYWVEAFYTDDNGTAQKATVGLFIVGEKEPGAPDIEKAYIVLDDYQSGEYIDISSDENQNRIKKVVFGEENLGSLRLEFDVVDDYLSDVEQDKRIARDVLINVVGGLATGGATTALAATETISSSLFYSGALVTGIYSVSAGGVKLLYDSNSEFEKSDNIPSTPGGVAGKIIGPMYGFEESSSQEMGDFINTMIYGDFKKLFTKPDSKRYLQAGLEVIIYMMDEDINNENTNDQSKGKKTD